MAEIEDYKLKVTNVEEQRRNFPGVKKNQYVKLAELQLGDTEGTTDTDVKTHIGKHQGYTRIYQ